MNFYIRAGLRLDATGAFGADASRDPHGALMALFSVLSESQQDRAVRALGWRFTHGMKACQAEQRGTSEWVCDCAAPGPNCKPTEWRAAGMNVPVPPSSEAEYQSWLPAGKHAPEKVYYMRNNHTFRALPLDVKAACEAIREEFTDGESYGMLCTKRPGAAAPLHAGKELAEFLPRAREWLITEFAARGVEGCKP